MFIEFGFVYLWFDKKRKMYYVGSHWQKKKNDNYICSSNRMRKSYKRRPKDFKRRIIKKIYTNRKDLLLEEYRYLQMIKKEELNVKYYNKRNHHFDHWSVDEKALLTVSERISIKTKEAMYREDVREKYLKGLLTRNNRSSEEETREKRRATMLKFERNKGKITVRDLEGNVFHATKNDSRWQTGEIKHICQDIKKGPLSEEHKKQISETTIFKELNIKKVKCTKCDFVGNVGCVAKWHNENCGVKQKNVKMAEKQKGTFWWNNGVINKRSKSSPGENWIRGRFKK